MLSNCKSKWSSNIPFIVVALILGACDGKNTSTGATCPQGDERCACFPNRTCQAGLACLSNVCVSNEVGEGGGVGTESPSLGGGGATPTTIGGGSGEIGGTSTTPSTNTTIGSGGSSGFGGNSVLVTGGSVAISSGGSVAIGGTAPTASGGMVAATGGATTNGGATATGGTSASTLVSTGGVPAAGGQTAAAGTSSVARPNLIKDGTFQSFDTYWNAILQEGDTGTYTRPPSASAVCVTNTSTSSSLYYELSFTIGYPNAALDTFVIEPGATYTLSYTVSAASPISFEVKIGHSVSPWTEVYSFRTDVLTSSYKTFSHQFTSTAGDSSAGLAFNAVLDLYGKMCFQQVSLTKN